LDDFEYANSPPLEERSIARQREFFRFGKANLEKTKQENFSGFKRRVGLIEQVFVLPTFEKTT
jgi:hypothetical protein